MKINILNLIDFEEVNKLLEGFNQSTGFVTAILDLEGNILSKSGWRQICTEFHRVNPETARNCKISDTILANRLATDEKYHFYECYNGLVDVAVPIVINGEHIANLFSGQFFFEEPNRAFFKKQAETKGFNEPDYLNALENVPIVSKDRVKVAMDFLLNMTQIISKITLQKMEQLQLYEALKKSEERSRNVLDYMLEGCQIIGHDWRYIYLNQTAEIHNRRSNSELLGKKYMDMWPGIENTEVFKIIEQVLKKRVTRHFENEFVFMDGSIGWFDLSIQPVAEGAFMLSVDITERKKAENALRQSEEKYRLISDNSDDWIYWVMPDGHLKYVSPACERVTGYSPGEFAIHPELMNEIVYPSDKDTVSQHSLIPFLDAVPHQLEYRILTKTGEIQWVSHSCNPIIGDNGEYLGRLGTNRNITNRKRKEEQLFESEFRFSNLYENGPFGIVMANKELRFKKANPKFCSILGYSEAEIQQFTFKEVTYPDDKEKDLSNVNKLMNKEISVYKTEKRYMRKDGQIIWGSLTVTATYDSEGKFLYHLGIIEDITSRKQAEAEVHKLNEMLEQRVLERTSELEAANKELEAFSYSVSHDLRAPLRHINGYVELLNEKFRDNLPDKARHYLTTVTEASKQMGALIDDLLQFSRTGRQDLHKTKLNMDVLVNEVLNKLKQDFEHREITWSVQQLPEVFGDFSLLKQVWVNLLENAVKYTGLIKSAEIAVGFREEKDKFVFYTRDNGVGFDMKYAHKLFGVFQRLHSQAEFEGTGIGLANVQRIIHKHKGLVWAEAEPGKGATFFFSLPKYKED